MLSLSRNQSLIMAALGLFLLSAKVLSQYFGFPFYYYLGWLSIPLLVIAMINLMPALQVPTFITSCAFPIYVCHMFIIDIAHKVTSYLEFDANLHISLWLILALGIFSLTLAVVLCFRRILPRSSKVIFGGR